MFSYLPAYQKVRARAQLEAYKQRNATMRVVLKGGGKEAVGVGDSAWCKCPSDEAAGVAAAGGCGGLGARRK